eukprot:CAMPEP_0197844412 /NCGR_PEP_ID=MMETSP1438-20131217/1397_1 /TAXON_ID=1461541 /ORGANISM="Pterosperma sp., Strain CCMP1384" /LENGTH=340 /DNA_ID=CAMNT_0043455179 /DNA_START=253 /DNA_END=1275 /DNA_ORIENTATION=+
MATCNPPSISSRASLQNCREWMRATQTARSRSRVLPTRRRSVRQRTHPARSGRSRFATKATIIIDEDFVDYYELFGVARDSNKDVIKKAYYNAQKECHPDLAGEGGADACVLLNAAYEILADPEQRSKYDAQLAIVDMNDDEGFTGEPLSQWSGAPGETQAVFVDECACIGCKQCIWEAEDTFTIDEDYGRSRVANQWANGEEELQNAIDSCPVDCIYWVEKEQLPVLEHVMAQMQRTDVGIMMARQGGAGADPFQEAALFARRRAERQEEIERMRTMDIFRTAAASSAAQQAAETLRRRAKKWGARWSPGGFGKQAKSNASSPGGAMVPAAEVKRERPF